MMKARALPPIGNSWFDWKFVIWNSLVALTDWVLTLKKTWFTCTKQEDNLTVTEIGDVVLLPLHDFLALNEEETFDLFNINSKNHMWSCAWSVFTRVPRLVKDHRLIAPHDPKWKKKSLGKVLERPLQKKQSRNKYGWTSLFCLGGDDFQSRIWNLCIEYFHTKAQKFQKVYWATKLNRMRRQGAVELDVGNNFASREIHCAVVLKREQGRF